MSEEKGVVVRKTFDMNKPSEMASMANVLKKHVVANKLFTPIANKNYVHVEGWQYAGAMLGLIPQIVSVKDLSTDKEIKWMAECEIVSMKDPDKVLSRGFAVCSKKESKKASFDEYAVCSMAQTRAVGKAYRNMLGWVMKLAGYEATPKEEMSKVDAEDAPAPRQAAAVPVSKGEQLYCHGVGRAGCPDGEEVTDEEANFSKRVFGKVLCRSCQKNAKKK